MTNEKATNAYVTTPSDLELLHLPESQTLERLSRYNLTTIGRTVCAFLNGEGGRVLVGVEDNGKVVGIPQAKEAVEKVQKEIFSRVQPPASCMASLLEVNRQDVLLLEVAPGADGPYTYAHTIYVREGNATRKATPKNVIELVGQLESNPRWEARTNLQCDLSDLDARELERTAEDANRRRYTDLPAEPERLLDSLYLIRGGALTNAAVVLYAKEAARFLPQTRVRAVHFADESREQMLDNKSFEGHVFSLLEQMSGFLQTNLAIKASLTETTGFVRTESVSFPPEALREALLNAIVHRDYSRSDGSISLSLFPRYLEIWNAGGLPEGVTLKNLREGGISRPRNPDLAHVLLLRGLIERMGIGGRRIIEACKNAGLPAPKWEEKAGGMLLTLRLPGAASTATIGEGARSTAELNPRVWKFLATLTAGQEFTGRDYQQQAAGEVSERQSRLDLAQMLKARAIERRGSGKNTYYVRTEQELK
ncbi:RNA-binding domain-containing protein [Hymenobacter weizhouensis]|uniref:RNA-binding domain-containing protein n=1 Tax=Hymenobacter sp. YIM 151500-1 TaxID=2987689 RepID=UPI0022265E9C|nr:RNA-binding domain-containing protein [Hymenobacter sp. YIM 151500-1]UYZ65336.1 putative DNA binding domain-containing protein [Hymenobacter sp. YIM 151500-1]